MPHRCTIVDPPRRGEASEIPRLVAAAVALGLLIGTLVQNGWHPMTVELMLKADDAHGGATSVSTTIALDLGSPTWQSTLLDAVEGQASEGARRLRDEILAQGHVATTGFIPLSSVVPVIAAGR